MDRREFLQSSSVGAVLGLLSQSSLAQQGELDQFELAQQMLAEAAGDPFFDSARATTAPVGMESHSPRPFAIYQLERSGNNLFSIVDPARVEPAVKGSNAKPDMGVQMSLAGAHFAESVWDRSRPNARATMRVTSRSGVSTDADTLHWALVAGLDLYEAYKGRRPITHPIELSTPLATGGQSLQFQEGAGALQISVLRHRKPSWWDTIFSFLRGSGGQALIASLGFPAITQPALRFVDELTNRIENRDREPIFQASFANVAFSERGRKAATFPAVLNEGLWLIANPSDKQAFDEHGAIYYGGFARMIPADMKESPNDILVRSDPFRDITYAVVDARFTPAKLLA